MILHGYAVGLGSQPGATSSDIHIEETAYLPAAASNPPSPPDTSRADVGPPPSSSAATQVALGNYRALFGLVGANEVTSAIDAIREQQRDAFPQHRERIEGYLRSLSGPPAVELITLEPSVPGVELPTVVNVGIIPAIAAAFLIQLIEILSNTRANLALPTAEPVFRESFVVFPDGFFVNAIPVLPAGDPFSPLTRSRGGAAVATPAALAMRAAMR